MRFIPVASVRCASGDNAPSDIAVEMKRRRMTSAGSTWSSATGTPVRIASKSRGPAGARAATLATKASYPWRCSAVTTGGDQPWSSPSLRKRTRPWSGSARSAPSSPYAARWRARTSSAISANPIPPIVDTVPVKQRSITSAPRPSASKIWAPQYEDSVDIPIFARTQAHGALRRRAQAIEGAAEGVRSARRPPQRRQRHSLIAGEVAQGHDLVFQENRVLGAHQPQRGWTVGEQRAASSQVHAQRHDEGLAQRVDRRVRHLREALADIRVQALRNARQRWDRRMVPHAPHGVLARRGHGLRDVAQVLEAPAEGELARDELGAVARRGGDPGSRAKRADRAGGPASVGAAAGHLPLGVGVAEDGLASRVHDDHLTGAQAPALDDLPRVQVHEPHLGPGDEQTVARDLVATGPQAVAVQRRAG